jgi:hypothetical protein
MTDYNNDVKEDCSNKRILMSICFFIISSIAVYYSFVIEKGFKLGPFLLAVFFSPVYLMWGIYKAGIPPKA